MFASSVPFAASVFADALAAIFSGGYWFGDRRLLYMGEDVVSQGFKTDQPDSFLRSLLAQAK